MAFIQVNNETHRIVAASEKYHCGDGELTVTFPEGVTIDNIGDYIYYNNEFVYSPIEVIESINDYDQLKQEIADLKQQNELLTDCILEITESLYGEESVQ